MVQTQKAHISLKKEGESDWKVYKKIAGDLQRLEIEEGVQVCEWRDFQERDKLVTG